MVDTSRHNHINKYDFPPLCDMPECMYYGTVLLFKNENEDNIIKTKNILVLDEKNKILGIGDSDERFEIKPKVVFNAIG